MKNIVAALISIFFTTALSTSAMAAPHSNDEEKRPIVLTLFLHEQLNAEQIADLQPSYVSWLVTDLEFITGREVQIITVENAPGFTDFNYRLDDADKSLYEWNERIIDYVMNNGLPRGKTHKYVLITPEDVSSDFKGIAGLGKRSAIASMSSYRTLAHEVGHLFGATHADGEFRAAAFPVACNTNMVEVELFFVKNCYHYSKKSAEVIWRYLKDTP